MGSQASPPWPSWELRGAPETRSLENRPRVWELFVGSGRGGEGDRGTGLGSLWGGHQGGEPTENYQGWGAGWQGSALAAGPGTLLGGETLPSKGRPEPADSSPRQMRGALCWEDPVPHSYMPVASSQAALAAPPSAKC